MGPTYLREIRTSMCPTGDKKKVCVLREIRTSMCPTGDKNKYVSYGRSEQE